MAKYTEPRPAIPADVRRSVEVESGHACGVAHCGDHTYLEIHHINVNRTDNRVENLILLCLKHHEMAHAGVIDRKALAEYKRLLRESYGAGLADRLRRLESLLSEGQRLEGSADSTAPDERNSDPDVPIKSVSQRSNLTYITLEQLALAKYEREHNLLLERQLTFTKGSSKLRLDALFQDDNLAEDVLVEVRWLRKRYLSSIWLGQVYAATSAYELMTGRKARGVLIYVVPTEDMKVVDNFTVFNELAKLGSKPPEIIHYTYTELGFDPDASLQGSLASNGKKRS